MSKSVAIIGTRGYPSYYGGFETAVRHIAPYLADAGWDVRVYGRTGATKSNDPTRDQRVENVRTPGIELRSVSTLSYGLSAVLHAVFHRPDVALVMNVANGYFLPFLRIRGIPSLVNVDGIEWERDKWGATAKRVFRLGARATARFGDRMVYDSTNIAARWESEFKRDGEFIAYGGDVPSELPLEAGLSHRGYVLVVARFVPENTVPEFVLAAAEISKLWPVVIVGSSGYGGELDRSVEELSATNPKVTWLGHVSDDQRLYSLWQHAGVYFHGHSVGGTNPALVQAMACGAPVVARDTLFNREVLGSSGVFVDPSPTAIATKINEMMSAPSMLDIMSTSNTARARSQYSWQSICERYAAALDALVNRKTRHGKS